MKRKPKVLISHPMWLIIKEDSLCLERTPPWGAATIEDYAGRLSNNLKCLEENKRLKVNYDFSAVELCDVNDMYPALAERIVQAVKRKQLALVNGTYSQAHLHILSLESSIRQFQEGKRLIKEIYGYDVLIYVMQEPGYTNQTPQILKAFGYGYFQQGCFITRKKVDIREHWTHSEPFLTWQGLDGSEILAASDAVNLDLSGMPDMYEIDIDDSSSYVLMDEFFIQEQMHDKSHKIPVRFWIPWSYLEGTDGEELSAVNTKCETALVQLDAAAALAQSVAGSSSLWKKWLLCQHHDAYWQGAPELRQKCKNWLADIIKTAEEETRNIISNKFSIVVNSNDDDTIVFTSVYPRPHKGVLSIEWKGTLPDVLINSTGEEVPVQQGIPGQSGNSLIIPYEFNGAGFTGFKYKSGTSPGTGFEFSDGPVEFANEYYKLCLNSDGSINSLETSGKKQLVGLGEADSVLTLGDEVFVPKGELKCIRGTVAAIFESIGTIGCIPVTRKTVCYNDLPWFDQYIECDFNNDSIGDFYKDETKLVLRWSYYGRFPEEKYWEHLSIIHGIGGGAAEPEDLKAPFFPVNWLDIGWNHDGGIVNEGCGIALINYGTNKNIMYNNKILNILAWGGNTKHFGNRCDNINGDVPRNMDLRLNGKHVYKFTAYPHDGDWRQAEVADIAMSLLRPPVAVCGKIQEGQVIADETMLCFKDSLIPSSLFSEGDKLVCRAYEAIGNDSPVSADYCGKDLKVEICDPAGNPTKPRPWGIYNIKISR